MSHRIHSIHTARRSSPPPAGTQFGLTLLEIMVATSISAILLGLAAPSMVDLMNANRARSSAQTLYSLLVEARTEAVRRNKSVLVCPSDDGGSCLGTIAATSWSGRTIACYDADGDGACDVDGAAAPAPIRVRGEIDRAVQLTGPTAFVRFNGLGAANGAASFSLAAGPKSSSVTVKATGAVRVD